VEPNARTGITEAVKIPLEFIELSELRWTGLDHKLGYFGQERFVIVGFSQRGKEVFWKDGHTSGFGLGHWQFFLDTLVPLGARRGIDLGGMDRSATHVVVLDRERKQAYLTCRNCAETFAARFYGRPPPTRECMCAARDETPREHPVLRSRRTSSRRFFS
jgi:hypothetical protein